jgi:putative SOS response-associated peptidase YedK
MVPLRWGLIPSWSKDARTGNRMINARAETVAVKPAYRTAFRKRRCLIPADGFYE